MIQALADLHTLFSLLCTGVTEWSIITGTMDILKKIVGHFKSL